jgi:transcriptional regulator with XRE-family HTH domain
MSSGNLYLKNLKKLRKKKGWTQEKLAREAGISYHTLIKIERGDIKDPRLGTLIKLAKALDVSIDKLIGSQK